MRLRDALRESGLADRDARLLLAHVLDVDTLNLSMMLDDALPEASGPRFAQLVAQREAGAPVSKLIGRRAFWKHEFIVTADVLDPRPETETLIELAASAPFERVLDLGTGSGCILISLLNEQKTATGVGVDLSENALAVAKRNADILGCADRAAFTVSDWFDAVQGRFDLIVSNPPYIAAAEMPELAREVRDHDPHMALSPGGDGLDAYRQIMQKADAFLSPQGRLLVEIGPTQAAAVTAMMKAAGLSKITVSPDLDGRDRVVSAEKT